MNEKDVLRIEEGEGTIVAGVEAAELTSVVMDSLRSRLAQLIKSDGPTNLVLDLSKVRLIDSVSIGAMVVLLRKVKGAGGRMGLAGMTGHCLNVMNVTGLHRIFEMYDDVASAVAAMAEPS